MKRLLCFGLLVSTVPFLSVSCVPKESERKVVGPSTDTSKIPWNRPIAGQGGGQMGMMPNSKYRR
ncbi:MAG: hypothetical protein R3242_08075 [Akkermansiaceae bacterium]|nr:hypothetical protein [Akkermansiaceae bacterium]